MLNQCEWSNVLEPYLNVLLAWHDIPGLRSQKVQSVIKVCRQEQVTIAFLTAIEENYNAKKKQYKESSGLYFFIIRGYHLTEEQEVGLCGSFLESSTIRKVHYLCGYPSWWGSLYLGHQMEEIRGCSSKMKVTL
jgi:hypothetical protein